MRFSRSTCVMLCIIAFELIGIAWLLLRSETPNVTRLIGEQYQGNPSSSFMYYYEPKPDSMLETLEIKNLMNSDGFNDTEHAVVKPSGTFRIIALGDSHTYGFGVLQEDAYPKRLEDILNGPGFSCSERIEVINLGVPGYDLAFSAERFRLRGAKYEPDLVTWFLADDDFTQDAEKNIADAGQPAVRNKGKDLIYSVFGIGFEAIIAKEERAFDAFANEYPGALAIINRGMPARDTEYLKKVAPYALMYSKNPGGAFFGPDELLQDGHPNEKGHLSLAKDVANFLVASNAVPCIAKESPQ